MAELHRYVDWQESDGDVLWWRFPINEPPYVGSPLDCGHPIKLTLSGHGGHEIASLSECVGGWPYLDADDGTLFWQRLDVPEMECD